MRFDERFLDEIKSRLRLSDVIGRTVKLRRQGREYAGLSPFTKEKSPSFFVNDDKGFYHCFSSGKHGDLISFLQETERLSFPEAVERLANEAGLTMPVQDARTVEDDRKKQGLSDWIEHAAAWFEGELKRPGGAEARAYLEKRGLPPAEWPKFRLGYAPGGRTALKDYLITKGASPGELVETGLLIAPEEGGAPYDRFRERIIFPITDQRGRVISFGGRAMDPNARAKYLNGPETSLFSKSRIVYGLPEARKLLATGEPGSPLVVVEGYMDVIACHRAGIAAIAPMGTALTEEQMELLWRFHPEPTLCFDGDAAGQRAAGRVIDRALPHLQPGRSFRFAELEGGKDPDEILRELGAAALKIQIGRTTPFVEKLFRREKDLGDLSTPERRAGFKVRLRQAAQAINEKDLSDQYRTELLRRFEEEFPRSAFVPHWKDRRTADFIQGVLDKAAAQKLKERARRLNACTAIKGIENPDWMLPYVEEIAAFGFGDAPLKKLVEPIVSALCLSTVSTEVVRALIQHEGAQAAFDSAFRIAHEVPMRMFEAADGRESHEVWRRAIEAIMEMAGIQQAMADKTLATDPNEHIERRRKLRARQMELARQLNDFSIWA